MRPEVRPSAESLSAAFLAQDLEPDEDVLDIGCGDGVLVRQYSGHGCRVIGLEIDPEAVDRLRGEGLDVRQGQAEALPFEAESFDRIVCSVVLPYTDERQAVAEWARVLRPGGRVLATFHGTGYGCRYLIQGNSIPQRFYGIRMLVNTSVYRWTGGRLPGFLGDTLCQTPSRMRRYYRGCGLELEQEQVMETCFGLPRIFGHSVRKLELRRSVLNGYAIPVPATLDGG